MANPGEPGPTPDSPEKSATPAEGEAKPEENNGWFDNLWRKTQKDAEDTIKFIEEEHKKNVQKFEAAVDEIKSTAEEVVDGLQSQLEGRKSLKMLREEKDAAEAALARVQVKLVASSKETQAAEEALDAAGGARRAPSDVTRRAKVSRSSLLLARSEFAAAQKTLREREEAVKRAEVELANSAKERNLINLLFKRKLTPEEEEEQRKLLEESRRLNAVVTIQRNFRKAREIRRAAARVAERRRKIRAGCVSAVKTVASFVLLYVALIFFGRFLAAAFGARRAAYEATTAAASDAWSRARALSPLDHGYVRYGIASKLEAGDALVLRERNRALGDRVAALELELSAATTALDRTHDASPCGDCARDVAARIDAEERARVAEERAATLSAEVVSLRAAASRSEMTAAKSRNAKGGRDADAIAKAPDAGVSYSAQVAAAATAAASVTLEARVSEATAAARAAMDEAEATKVEIEVLRNLIDEGFLPGGAGGKCWAEVADARARAQITAASVASVEAKRNAEAMLSEKLTLYADARRDAERKADAYRVELEALRAAAPELRHVADDAAADADRTDDATGTRGYWHSRDAARTRKTVVGASRLVAAAKVASERVRDAATALRDAESRAEVRRVELETLRHLVGGNGTAGVIDRAERVVSELPGAAARATEAAERRVAARLRAEEEARAQAETKAEVYRVELASLRAIEAERAEAEAEARANSPLGFGNGHGHGHGHGHGRGSVKALAAEVRRLEKALAKAEASASASVAAATPEAAAAAATVAALAAADAAAEADAARERWRDGAPLVRRVAARIVAWTLGESHETRDALRRRVVSLERRLVAMTRAAAVGPGPACAAALTEALDATRRAEANAESLSVELDAARGVAAALRDGDDAAAADALIVAADKHRKLLTSERSANREALESCRGHAAAASQRAFAASRAAADASDLFERHKLRLAAESLEERRADAMRRSVRAVGAGADGSESGSESGSDPSLAANVSPPASSSPSTAAAIDAAVAAVAEADARAVALASKLRDAERRWRLAPGTLDAYVPREYSEGDAWLLCAATGALAVALTIVASRSLIPAYAALVARLAVEKARLANARRGLEEARYDAEVHRDRAAAAEVATNEAHAEAARHLYAGFDDGRHLGTVVDEMRANLRRTSEVNDALRKDNDWLRAKLRDTQEAQMAFLAAPAGGWATFRRAHEERSAELLKLRSEVERLRSARLDASATAAAAVRADARKNPGKSAVSAGELKLGSPSFRTGMAAAREAAEREAAALRDEAEALRDANEKLLAEAARLRRDNEELMEDLGGDAAPGVTARDAARQLREQMAALDALNEAQAETAAAEMAARAELVRRNAALALEATRERKIQSKVFFAGAAAFGTYAVAAGASFGVAGADVFTGAAGFSAVAVVTLAAVVSACLAAWAVVFSVPNANVRKLVLPVETVALVDEDDVVLADGATKGARLVADTDAKEALENATKDEGGEGGGEGGEAAAGAAAAAAAEKTAASAESPTAAAITAPTSPAAPPGVSSADAAGPGGPSPAAAPPAPEDVTDEAYFAENSPYASFKKVRSLDYDSEEEAASARRDAEIAKLRGELSKAQADADRLRQSRNRLARRAEGMRDENEALTAARDEVMSQAETMSLARSAGGAAASAEAAERERAEQRERERREETLRRQLTNYRVANERLEAELAALRKDSDDAEAEAEAASAEASLYDHASDEDASADAAASASANVTAASPTHSTATSPTRSSLPAIDREAYAAAMRRAAKAESALSPALERAARAEAALPSALERAARAEAAATRADAAVAAARHEMEALTRAKDALAKEIEWLKQSRERLLREVAALRSANGELERDLKLGDERRVEVEGRLASSYEHASTLERNLADAEKRAEAAILANDTLERDLEAAEEAARRAREEGPGAEALRRARQDAEEAREATRVVVRADREARDAATRLLETTRAENAALSRDLAAAREALLAAREEAAEAEAAKSEAAPGTPSGDADAETERLRREVERLSSRVKEAYVRETELKRQLARAAEKVDGADGADGAEAKTDGGTSGTSSASASGTSATPFRRPSSRARVEALRAVAFLRASAERRYAARRRAVSLLVAATTPTEEMRADPVGTRRRWRVARSAIVSVSRVMTGSSAYAAFSDGALSSSLALMAASPRDRNVQVSGCRVIASMVTSPTMAAHARRAPSFAGGGALRAAATALEYHAADAGAARAAARAMWTAVHLGGRPSQDEVISARLYERVVAAMAAHAEEGSVLEACCGCLLATALGNEEAKVALDAAGARAEVRRTMRDRGAKGHVMRFGGAFVSLKEWLRGTEGTPVGKGIRKPKGLASGVTSKALSGL